jgi:hypothetical protein
VLTAATDNAEAATSVARKGSEVSAASSKTTTTPKGKAVSPAPLDIVNSNLSVDFSVEIVWFN